MPGRSETIELWPFSQGEIDGTPDGFVDAIFSEGESLNHSSHLERRDYAERVVRGGFPEAVARANPARRERFFDAYLSDLITRDVSQLADISRVAEMRALMRLVAARSGQLLSVRDLATRIELSAGTVHRYLGLLEEVFLIKRIPAWVRNIGRRAIGMPKLAFVDSGLAADLLATEARALVRPGGPFGPRLRAIPISALWEVG